MVFKRRTQIWMNMLAISKPGFARTAGGWYLYKMVAQNMVRIYELKEFFSEIFRIWRLFRCNQMPLRNEIPDSFYTCAPCSVLPSSISSMGRRNSIHSSWQFLFFEQTRAIQLSSSQHTHTLYSLNSFIHSFIHLFIHSFIKHGLT